jgi:transcriptional regulator with XRE-family HTH domain
MTQRELGVAAGLAVTYLSRVENSRLTPSIPTLTRIADALEVPMSALFDASRLEEKDLCPVSLSGRCILDQKHLGRGRKPDKDVETYTREQLEILRLCNLLLHSQDKDLLRALQTLMKGLLVLKQAKKDVSALSREN